MSYRERERERESDVIRITSGVLVATLLRAGKQRMRRPFLSTPPGRRHSRFSIVSSISAAVVGGCPIRTESTLGSEDSSEITVILLTSEARWKGEAPEKCWNSTLQSLRGDVGGLRGCESIGSS